MATRYHVIVKNQAGVQVAFLTDWRRLEYTKNLNGVGTYTLTIDGDSPVVDDFELHAQIEVYRYDIDALPPIAPYKDFEAFHYTEQRQTLENGNKQYTSYGASYESLLEGRHVLYYPGSPQADKSGMGETVMKAFVYENAGPGATFPPRLEASGVQPGLSVQASAGGGDSFDGARAYQNLLDLCQEISDATKVDFAIVGTGAALFEFQAKASPWGRDRSVVGLNPMTGLNAAGYAPVIFALERANMRTPSYVLNRRAERNAVIVLGQGIADDRQLVQRLDAAAIADSPWNRREMTRQGNSEELIAGLNAIGDALLFQLKAAEDFRFDLFETNACRYGRDFFWGDIVTGRYDDIERSRKIVGITIVVAEGKEVISTELGNVQ